MDDIQVFIPENTHLPKIIEMLTSGVKPEHMLKSLEQADIKLTKDELIILIVEGLKYYKNLTEFNPDVELGKSIDRLNVLYNKCYKIQDFKACLQIETQRIKLLKIEPKKNHDETLQNFQLPQSFISGDDK